MNVKELLARYATGERSFNGIVLKGANLEGVNLGGVDFGRADLRGANLTDDYLSGANLS
ncbi:MAG: pentapeptide repeat-containing protein [Dolichospermum sp.]